MTIRSQVRIAIVGRTSMKLESHHHVIFITILPQLHHVMDITVTITQLRVMDLIVMETTLQPSHVPTVDAAAHSIKE